MSRRKSPAARRSPNNNLGLGQGIKVFELHLQAPRPPARETAPLLRTPCTHRLGAYTGGWW